MYNRLDRCNEKMLRHRAHVPWWLTWRKQHSLIYQIHLNVSKCMYKVADIQWIYSWNLTHAFFWFNGKWILFYCILSIIYSVIPKSRGSAGKTRWDRSFSTSLPDHTSAFYRTALLLLGQVNRTRIFRNHCILIHPTPHHTRCMMTKIPAKLGYFKCYSYFPRQCWSVKGDKSFFYFLQKLRASMNNTVLLDSQYLIYEILSLLAMKKLSQIDIFMHDHYNY